MNPQTNLTITMAGSLLMGAGLAQLGSGTTMGLILVGVGAVLQIVVAILQKEGISVQTSQG